MLFMITVFFGKILRGSEAALNFVGTDIRNISHCARLSFFAADNGAVANLLIITVKSFSFLMYNAIHDDA